MQPFMGQLDGMIHGLELIKIEISIGKRSYEMMQDINIINGKMSELSKNTQPSFKTEFRVISYLILLRMFMKKVDYFVSVKIKCTI